MINRTLHLHGKSANSIAGFYSEINRLFMEGEDWQLGESLDALNDLLCGGFGILKQHPHCTLVWKDAAVSREGLGTEATLAWYRSKLGQPQFNQEYLHTKIRELEEGRGSTYFDIILEIFSSHPNIRLVLK